MALKLLCKFIKVQTSSIFGYGNSGQVKSYFQLSSLYFIFLNEKLHCVHVINSFLYPILIFKILIMAMTKIWLNTIIIYVSKSLFQLRQPGYVVKLFDKYIYLVCRLATQRQCARKK